MPLTSFPRTQRAFGHLGTWLNNIRSAFDPPLEQDDGTAENLVLFADAEGNYQHVSAPRQRLETVHEHEYEDQELDEYEYEYGSQLTPLPRRVTTTSIVWLCIVIGLGWTFGLYIAYPTPSTVPLFIGGAISTCGWVIITWIGLLMELLRRRETARKIWSRWTMRFRIGCGLATALVIWWAIISVPAAQEEAAPVMIGNGEKYFIAVNLYNSEAIMSDFISELTSLLFHLGRHDVFVSIYESNSFDGTKTFLHGFDDSLTNLGIAHRINMVDKDLSSKWPYGTSPERISFLAKCRNKAMEPIQSTDDDVRIPDWRDYTKVIFLNDIRFKWEDIVKLILTEVPGLPSQENGYDLACAMDFGSSGLYDTWVARDVCGTPFRAFWPYVADSPSQLAIRNQEPFEVSSCWNGAVVFDAEPFLYAHNTSSSTDVSYPPTGSDLGLSKRGWKMVDNSTYPGAKMSPPLSSPIQFRNSGIEACDHSECFLLSYDLHRLYSGTEHRPRIVMNPAVKVAYEKNWFHWNHVVLRRPIVKWWQSIWSHRISYWLFDFPFEHFGRRRDYCTWAGLGIPTEDGRCRPLPGPEERHWDE